jgi:hypothetical protein
VGGETPHLTLRRVDGGGEGGLVAGLRVEEEAGEVVDRRTVSGNSRCPPVDYQA